MIRQEDHYGNAESQTITADLDLTWGSARYINVNATSGTPDVTLPSALGRGTGGPFFVIRCSGNQITIKDAGGGTIATIGVGATEIAALYLLDDSTAAGDWSADVWEDGDFPVPSWEHVGHVLGGDGSTDTTNESYSKATDNWTANTALTRDRREACAVTLGHKALQVGGDSSSYYDKLDIYDKAGDSWSAGTDAPIDYQQASGVQFRLSAIFFGGKYGLDGDETRRTDGTTWVALTDMPDDREERSSTRVGGVALVLSEGQLLSYSEAEDAYTVRAARSGSSLSRQTFGAIDGYGYAFNGRSDASTVVDRTDRYDAFSDTWKTVTIGSTITRADAAFCAIEGMAVLAGGTAASDFSPEAEAYRFDGSAFVALTSKTTAVSKTRNCGAVMA